MRGLVTCRPSPALVVACIALLIALGGTSLAAVTALPRNSVGTVQLKNNAVTGAKVAPNAVASTKIANLAVTNAKIGTDAVTSAKVKNGSLVAADFAPGELPTPGQPGPGTLTLHSVSVVIGNNNSSERTATCPSGQQAVSGGATWSDKGDLLLTLVSSHPVYDTRSGEASGWVARGRNQTAKHREFIVQVLCGKGK
jgi:hypothetical protein